MGLRTHVEWSYQDARLDQRSRVLGGVEPRIEELLPQPTRFIHILSQVEATQQLLDSGSSLTMTELLSA